MNSVQGLLSGLSMRLLYFVHVCCICCGLVLLVVMVCVYVEECG